MLFGNLDEPLDLLQMGEPVFGQQFEYMFPDLDAAEHDRKFLQMLGAKGRPMDEEEADQPGGDSSLPAGNAFLGQYIDHTITLEVQSELRERAETDALQNFRTPRVDLDSVYGADPEVDNYLYHQEGPAAKTAKLLVGVDDNDNEIDDLQRNQEGIAIIGDPRNDENAIISQMQLAFIRFHNRVINKLVDAGEDDGDLLERAQKLVRWHFQWVVVNQFLPRICEQSVLDDVLHSISRRTLPRTCTSRSSSLAQPTDTATVRSARSTG